MVALNYPLPEKSLCTMQKEKLDSIQMFRCFAALFVVIFHFREVLPFSYNSFIGHFIIRGYSGVDMFFLISGFIAFYTIQNSEKYESNAGLRYFLKRTAKIIPLYYIFTLLSSGHTLDSFYQTLKSLLFIPPDLGREGPIYGGARVGQGWTLNYEMYFYLVVAASFLFGRYKWFFTYGFISAAILIPVVIFGTPHNYGHAGFSFDVIYFSLMSKPINLEFLLGVTVGFIHSKMDKKLNIFWIFATAATLIYFFRNFYSQLHNYSRITEWGIPAAMLMLSVLKLEKSGKLKIPSPLVRLGNMSFSIYLVHAGVIGLLTKIASHTFNKGKDGYNVLMGMGIFATAIILTFLISKFTYTFIELKISYKLRSWFLSRKILNKTYHRAHI